jgi:hypothetical protein
MNSIWSLKKMTKNQFALQIMPKLTFVRIFKTQLKNTIPFVMNKIIVINPNMSMWMRILTKFHII